MGDDMNDKEERLRAASNPRRATLDDARPIARMFASAFRDDPLFNYILRDTRHEAALEMMFHRMLSRAIPQNEVWMSADGHACVSWVPPGGQRGPSRGLYNQLRFLWLGLNICGPAKFLRSLPIWEAMEKNHPSERHAYLSLIAVSPEYRGAGLGSRILNATLRHLDEGGTAAYVENSNPERSNAFYERAGFVARKNIAPQGAPPLIAMWREPKT